MFVSHCLLKNLDETRSRQKIELYSHRNYCIPLHGVLFYATKWQFFKKIHGAKGLNLPSILEETRVLYKYLSTTCVFMNKGAPEH